jgi:hypothetical protein
MIVPPALSWSLQIGSGILWTAVYLLIIRLGFREKTYGMPITALCANVSWEFIFSFIYPQAPPQNYVNVVWFVFDLVIVFQTLRFGRSALQHEALFYPAFILGMVASFSAILAITNEFNDMDGKYAAFGQNLMMSVLFVAMLLKRQDVTGQSVYIAFFKMIGTLLPAILFFLRFPTSPLLTFLYISIFLFDLIYVALLHAKHRELGINPWLRI